jgi:predicted mannosyl-3-phosphoglycerate phosphatase (HAD superfamily)
LTESQRVYLIGTLLEVDKELLGVPGEKPEPVSEKVEEVIPEPTTEERLTQIDKRIEEIHTEIKKLAGSYSIERLREIGFEKLENNTIGQLLRELTALEKERATLTENA